MILPDCRKSDFSDMERSKLERRGNTRVELVGLEIGHFTLKAKLVDVPST